jgi:hypothetical protein
MLTELNSTNGANVITQDIAKKCLNEFTGHLYGLEMGVAYGGGIFGIGTNWKERGTVWGFDTYEGHPQDEMLSRCEISRNAGGINSKAARCMDIWYQPNSFGPDKIKYDYIRSELDRHNLSNVHLVKGLVTNKTDVSFIPHLHYALIDMDYPQAQRDGYELLKNKFVPGGYLCLHDMIPHGHIQGCYEIYQDILNEGLFELVTEVPNSFLVVLKKK